VTDFVYSAVNVRFILWGHFSCKHAMHALVGSIGGDSQVTFSL